MLPTVSSVIEFNMYVIGCFRVVFLSTAFELREFVTHLLSPTPRDRRFLPLPSLVGPPPDPRRSGPAAGLHLVALG